MALSQSAIDMVKATAPAVAPHAKTIVTNFYKKMLGSHPELYAFFNKGHQSSGRQPQALTDAVLAYATNIDNLGVLGPAVGLMATKHCALQVMPEHYGIVHDNLMASIAEILGPDVATPEVGAGWSEAVMALAGILIEEEAKMYAAAAARKGGWKGWREFKLAAKEEVAPGVCTFTWEAADGYKEGFEFTPGQYMTLSLGLKDEGGDIISPRHYTITSPPGAATLQCTVKHLEDGVVSTALHGMEVGASVNMSPPFGVFTPPAEGDVVLVGAGVGVTPMYAFQQAMGERVAAVLQVDKSAAAAPFSSYFADAANSFSLVESTDGRPAAVELVSTLAGTVDLSDKEVLLCGPGSFMTDMKAALAEAGAKKVSYENFGPRS